MKKLGLALFSCIALVAFMGMSGSALGGPIDPSCDGTPYPNDPAIHDFEIHVPAGDSRKTGAVAGIGGSGVVCGSTATFAGRDTLYNSANIGVLDTTVRVNPTSTMTTSSFSGHAVFNLGSSLLGVVEDQRATLTIRPVSECAAEPVVGGPVPGTIIACHRADSDLGWNLNWNTDTDPGPGQSLVLTIGPVHPTLGRAGITHIKEFNFCANAGAVGGSVYPNDCGSGSDPWLQKNGVATTGRVPCAAGDNYSAKATQWGGLVTPPVSTCSLWTPDSSITPPAPKGLGPGTGTPAPSNPAGGAARTAGG